MSAGSSYGSTQHHSTRKNTDYYDIQSILFSQSQIPSIVASDIHGLGHLDPSGQDEEDLKRGAKVDLPLWLTETLSRKGLIGVQLPKTHAKAIREELQADASHVSMAQNPYIYELGVALAPLTGDAGLGPILSDTFAARFPQLWDKSRNWRDEDTSAATATMSQAERKLFAQGYNSSLDYQRWVHRKQEGIAAAAVVQAVGRNRKRAKPSGT